MTRVPLPRRLKRAAAKSRGVNLTAAELPRVYLAARHARGAADVWVEAMRGAILAKRAFRLDVVRTATAAELLDGHA